MAETIWFCVAVVFVLELTRNRDMNANCEWYIIVKYTPDNFCGVLVDAIYAPTSVHALLNVSRGPKKPGENFRAFAAISANQIQTAIALHERRRKADREWKQLVEHFEDAWMDAIRDGMPVEPQRKN